MNQPDQETMDDPLFDALNEVWEHVLMAYKQVDDGKTVMLYDIQERRIYSYQYEGFKSDMSQSPRLRWRSNTSGPLPQANGRVRAR